VKLLKRDRPHMQAVALDISPAMLKMARDYFADDYRVKLVEHDLSYPLPELGLFDAVVSSFAIHHLTHKRKRSLYSEVFGILNPAGIFCNLEHVASPTAGLRERFLTAIGAKLSKFVKEDKSNKLLAMGTQLCWLREIGFIDVDCYWKWLELALLVGIKSQ
jgi:tRNA (cmo5U34)-methyltransferase